VTVSVSRRDFLKYCIGSATVLGLDFTMLGRLEKALSAGGGPPIIWLAAANCTGCTVSLANRVSSSSPTDVADLLLNTVNLAYHPNLMGAAGDLAVSRLRETEKGSFVLAVEGGIPTAFDGMTCMLWTENGEEITALRAVQELSQSAAHVLSIGTCASFGGIPGGDPNPTGVQAVSKISSKPPVNIPGCPAHPDWVIGTIAQLLAGSVPDLDSSRRPTSFYGSATVHDQCPRRDSGWAPTFGVDGKCLQGLGCKGSGTHADCPSRQWNNKTNWCIGANSICLGCTESGFPDRFSPFYGSAGALPPGHPEVTGSCDQCHGSGEGGGSQLPPGHPPVSGSCSRCHDDD
jgi:NiFe hydrogenase small subunit HydA